jgi:hypothetical protein
MHNEMQQRENNFTLIHWVQTNEIIFCSIRIKFTKTNEEYTEMVKHHLTWYKQFNKRTV